MNTVVTPFIAGFTPHYFYIWHTMVSINIYLFIMIKINVQFLLQKAIFLLTFRLWWYRQTQFHYFLFDFCYFANFMLFMVDST